MFFFFIISASVPPDTEKYLFEALRRSHRLVVQSTVTSLLHIGRDYLSRSPICAKYNSDRDVFETGGDKNVLIFLNETTAKDQNKKNCCHLTVCCISEPRLKLFLVQLTSVLPADCSIRVLNKPRREQETCSDIGKIDLLMRELLAVSELSKLPAAQTGQQQQQQQLPQEESSNTKKYFVVARNDYLQCKENIIKHTLVTDQALL